MRKAAVEALGKLPLPFLAQVAATTLVPRCDDAEFYVRSAALEAVGQLDPSFFEAHPLGAALLQRLIASREQGTLHGPVASSLSPSAIRATLSKLRTPGERHLALQGASTVGGSKEWCTYP